MKKLNLIVIGLFLLTAPATFGQGKKMKDDCTPMQKRQCMQMNGPHMGMQMGQQGMMMNHYMMIAEKMPGHHEKLDLSEEQSTQLLDIRAKYKVEKAGLEAQLAKDQYKMKELLLEDAPSGDVRKQMKACSDSKIEMRVAAYEAYQEMMNVLSDEQKEKLMEMGKDCPEDCPMRMKKKQMMMKNKQ